MKLICDKCGEEFESGILNVLEHQFEKCKAHTVERVETDFDNLLVKTMPRISPEVKKVDDRSQW